MIFFIQYHEYFDSIDIIIRTSRNINCFNINVYSFDTFLNCFDYERIKKFLFYHQQVF